jgi:hypothetical protein
MNALAGLAPLPGLPPYRACPLTGPAPNRLLDRRSASLGFIRLLTNGFTANLIET